MLPAVSIIIPNYNHANFLEERIASIQNQTFTNFECLILDDASTDNSLEIIKDITANDKRFSCIASTTNSGSPFIQWNKGIQMAKGELVWIAESDDKADSTFLETMVSCLEANPAAALAYCQSYKMDKQGTVTGTWKEWTDELDENIFKGDFTMDGKKYIGQFLIHRNTIPNASAVVFRRSVYNEVGGADENIRNCSDWLTWLKMLLNHNIIFVSKPLNYFRFHNESVIAKAHISNSVYGYEFDYDMRSAFNEFLVSKNDSSLSPIKKINDRFIFHSIGNYGLYNFRSGKKLKGLRQICRASLYPVLNLNFIKRLVIPGRVKA